MLARRTIALLAVVFIAALSLVLVLPPAMRTPFAEEQGPTINELRGVEEGQTLHGKVAIEAIVGGTTIQRVEFRLDGPKPALHNEYSAPYFFMGDANGTPRGWDTTQFPDGVYTLTVTATDTQGRRVARQVHFALANTSQPTALPTTGPTEVLTATATITATPTLAPMPTITATTAPTAQPTIPPDSGSSAVLPIYTDALASGWVNWSWNTTVDLANTAQPHSGSAAIAVSYQAGWAGLYLHTNSAVNTSSYDTLRFWINGGSDGGQRLRVYLYDQRGGGGDTVAVTPQADTWTKIDVSLSTLGHPDGISGIAWQDTSGGAQPTFFIDDVALVASGSAPPVPISGPALTVDVRTGQRPISPDIYGMNFPSEQLARELRLPVQRWGGNATTRYNWRTDTANRAADWFFENIPNNSPDPSTLPNGSASDRFVEQGQRVGAHSLLTIPIIGWTPKERANACGFSVSKYGPQQRTDQYRPDCGNGVTAGGQPISGNDPHDTSAEIGPDFVQDWLRHLVGRYGTAAQGGVAFYNLDNEPSLWHTTHRDVHPQPLGYDELRDRTYQYAAAIKAIDPTAQTLGPAEWGWTSYFYSALDQQGKLWWLNPQDRNAHGGVPLVMWYLQQMRAYDQQHGQRILDYLDLHYYPQGQGVALASAGTSATQDLRLRSTRALWDPSYTDESWIGEPVRLIPRMREWVDQAYPGTKLAISEYNWGALDSMNGALAQADVLGIFGREGLDLATLWSPPTPEQPGAFAFRMYRNYDGQGAAFGSTSVNAASADQGRLAIYAALRDDGALTCIVINKSNEDLTSHVSLAGFTPVRGVQIYRYSTANLRGIERQPDLEAHTDGLTATFPRLSISLLVIPASPS